MRQSRSNPNAGESRRFPPGLLLSAAVGSHVPARPVLAILADDWTMRGQPAEVFVGAPRAVKDWR